MDHCPKALDHCPKRMNHCPHAMDHCPKPMDHSPKSMDHCPNAMDHSTKPTDHSPKPMDHSLHPYGSLPQKHGSLAENQWITPQSLSTTRQIPLVVARSQLFLWFGAVIQRLQRVILRLCTVLLYTLYHGSVLQAVVQRALF